MIGTIQDAVNNVGRCPKCGSTMVAMSKGNGLRCAKPGNRWLPGQRRWSQCDYSIFLQTTDDPTKFVIRPATFPEIAKPTEQQKAFRKEMSSRTSRLLVSNAGPGCAKTSTVSWSLSEVAERTTLHDYNLLAFNRNAKEVLTEKLPYAVSDIYTMNGFGMKKQGYKANQIDERKIQTLYKMISNNAGHSKKVVELVEKMRAWGLYAPASETNWWERAINKTVERFQLLSKVQNWQEVNFLFHKWVPSLCERALFESHRIDLTEQWFRPVSLAMHNSGLLLRPEILERGFVFSDEFVQHMAKIVQAIDVQPVHGLVIDEGQDLSMGQMLFFLACSWKESEVVLIGDDRNGEPGDHDWKCGQGIYGWRGSFGGSMKLFGRIWQVLTGDKPTQIPLSVTHRCSAEVVQALRPLNATLTTSRPEGSGSAFSTSSEMAFKIWKELPEDTTAFWITRTNREAGKVFVSTIKNKIKCGFRGGENFPRQITSILERASGIKMDSQGNFRGANLQIVQDKLSEELEGLPTVQREEMIESFILSVIEEVVNNPSILSFAGIDSIATCGNIRRFLLYFADNNSNRTITNVYRVKGDEAKWVIVSDCSAFNAAWGGDEEEAQACRFVACSRAIDALVVAGQLKDIDTRYE